MTHLQQRGLFVGLGQSLQETLVRYKLLKKIIPPAFRNKELDKLPRQQKVDTRKPFSNTRLFLHPYADEGRNMKTP
jgi:hypothetical protein